MSGSAPDGYTVSVSACPARPTHVTPTLAEAARGYGPFRSLEMRGWEGRVVGVTNAQCMLGVRVPDRSRAILVVTVDGELAVAVRDAVSPGMAVVRDARSEDAGAIAASCLPWPWMVVGSAVSLSPALAALLRDRPVLTYWFGATPAGLPGHARVFDRAGGAARRGRPGMRCDCRRHAARAGKRRRARGRDPAAGSGARVAGRSVSGRICAPGTHVPLGRQRARAAPRRMGGQT